MRPHLHVVFNQWVHVNVWCVDDERQQVAARDVSPALHQQGHRRAGLRVVLRGEGRAHPVLRGPVAPRSEQLQLATELGMLWFLWWLFWLWVGVFWLGVWLLLLTATAHIQIKYSTSRTTRSAPSRSLNTSPTSSSRKVLLFAFCISYVYGPGRAGPNFV